MTILREWLRRKISICLVLFLAVPFGTATALGQLSSPPAQQTDGASSAQALPQTPNPQATNGAISNSVPSNGSIGKSHAVGDPVTTNPVLSPVSDQNQQPSALSSAAEDQQTNTSQPVGTAAAPYQTTTGVAASRPAGAAIAPAKQKRVRSILIKVGVLVGAAVAIGTVVALSSVSPSRP